MVSLLCLAVPVAGQSRPAAPKPPNASQNTPAPKSEPKAVLDIPMILVEGGVYYMGCSAEQGDHGEDCEDNENPQREVTLAAFEIGKYEVTQGEWKAVMRYNASKFKGDDLPVENVTWDEVQLFLRRLNTLTGKTYRLPTEAEWEYAARGGVKSKAYKYSGGEVGWCGGNSGQETHAAGSTKLANELGVYDMSGNVWELCQDWYGNYPKAASVNPRGVPPAAYRVVRGGAWDSVDEKCRTTSRHFSAPNTPQSSIGFRLARTLSQ
jgi:formylglycine-generating enzyme required for sulfatase activity